MVKGRQKLAQPVVTRTLILFESQNDALTKLAAYQGRKLKRYVSVSELVREAVNIYLAANNFFNKEIA